MLHTISATFEDLENKHVADLGCGCGVLSIGSVMMGAGAVTGIDLDSDALALFSQNIEGELIVSVLIKRAMCWLTCWFYQIILDFDIDNIDIINADISNIGDEWKDKFDTVIMNPPFGTKHNKGLDMVFLQRAILMARKAVYSLHKTSTREHILKKAEGWGVRPQG